MYKGGLSDQSLQSTGCIPRIPFTQFVLEVLEHSCLCFSVVVGHMVVEKKRVSNTLPYLALKVFLIGQLHMESHACQGWLTLKALTTMVHLIKILLLGTLDSVLIILNTINVQNIYMLKKVA